MSLDLLDELLMRGRLVGGEGNVLKVGNIEKIWESDAKGAGGGEAGGSVAGGDVVDFSEGACW